MSLGSSYTSPSSDWNTLHAPISFLPHCLVHFWVARAFPTAPQPLDLPSTPRGCPVLLSEHLYCRTLFVSPITTVKRRTLPLLHTTHRVKSNFFLDFTLPDGYVNLPSPKATPYHPWCKPTGCWSMGSSCSFEGFLSPPGPYVAAPSYHSYPLTLHVKSAGKAPPDTQATAAPLWFSALWTTAALRTPHHLCWMFVFIIGLFISYLCAPTEVKIPWAYRPCMFCFFT